MERDRATVFVAERRLGDRGPLQDAVAQTDSALEQARARLATATADLGPTSRTALQEAEGGFAQLAVLRSDVGGSAQLDAAQVVRRYTGDHRPHGRARPRAAAAAGHPRGRRAGGRADGRQRARPRRSRGSTPSSAPPCAPGRVTPDDRAAVNATDNAFATGYSFYLLALAPTQTPVNFVASPGERASATRSRPPS